MERERSEEIVTLMEKEDLANPQKRERKISRTTLSEKTNLVK